MKTELDRTLEYWGCDTESLAIDAAHSAKEATQMIPSHKLRTLWRDAQVAIWRRVALYALSRILRQLETAVQ